jgi:GTPase SAR1 family protein
MFGKLWNHYIRMQDGFIFVIDASNQDELEDAMVELHKIARVVEEQGDPLLILFNKMDEVDTPVEELLERIHLKVKPHHFFFTSVLNNEQVFESFEWLANKILRNILRDKDWNK